MQGYKNLWTQVVQPPRVSYSEEYQLDDELSFDNDGKEIVYKRSDFTIKTEEPDNVLFMRQLIKAQKRQLCIIIRLMGIDQKPNFAILLFDSRGCGNNKSEYVTLGLRESLDLDLILSYLIKENHYQEIFLWGRSMGAVAIISYLHLNETRIIYKKVEDLRQQYFEKGKSKQIEQKFARERKKYLKMFSELYMTLKNQQESFFKDCHLKKQRVKFAVVDAPFKDCHEMLKNIIVNEAGYSNVSAKLVLYFFRNSIWNNLKYDVVGNNRPFKKVQYIETPVMFFAGDQDTLCRINDLQLMFDDWNSDIKYFRIMEDIDHSAPRKEEDIQYCIQQLNEFCKRSYNSIQKGIITNKKGEIKIEKQNKDQKKSEIDKKKSDEQENNNEEIETELMKKTEQNIHKNLNQDTKKSQQIQENNQESISETKDKKEQNKEKVEKEESKNDIDTTQTTKSQIDQIDQIDQVQEDSKNLQQNKIIENEKDQQNYIIYSSEFGYNFA